MCCFAATNRPDVLDPALLRPGRFDRQVVVDLPDIRGREAILKVHMRKVPISADVDPSVIARGTPGFSGADLANLINEAALFAARYSDKKIDQNHLDLAKDKIMMGAKRKSMILSEEQKRITAYHEAGHAIVGRLSPKHDPVYKVTIFVAMFVATSISLDAPVVMPLSPLIIFSAILPPNNAHILLSKYSLLCIYVSSSGRNMVTPRALPLGIMVTLWLQI